MAKKNIDVDADETIRRFLSQMNNINNTWGGTNASTASVPQNLTSEQQNEANGVRGALKNGATPNEPSVQRTQPIDIPYSAHTITPTRNSPASPGLHPISSPHFSGLRPPQNTPKTNPASPHMGSTRDYDEELADVAHVVSTIIDTMETKPLSQSMWASESNKYQPSLFSRYRTPSRSLAPRKIVETKPGITDSTTRMSFKAADSANVVGQQKIGNHLIVPTSRHGSLKAPPSAAEKYSALADDGSKPKTVAIPSSESPVSLALNPAQLHEKEASMTSNFTSSSLPSHMRANSQVPQFALRAKTAEVKEPNNKPASASEGSLKSPTSSIVSEQSRNPSGLEFRTSVAGTDTQSIDSSTTVVEDHLVTALQKLGSAGALKDDERDLLAELTSRILRRNTSLESIEVAESVNKTAEMELPTGFLDKWAPQPKDTKENSATSNKTTEATPTATKKPLASIAASIDPSEADARTPLAAKDTNVSGKSDEDLEDREHKTVFNTWPQLEKRDRPAAQIRTVIITYLPRNATPSFIASLVYGGPVEEIFMREGSATVRFMDAEACQKYYDDTSNGVVYGKDGQGREQVVFVELAKDVDVIGGLLQGWIATGVTRCVRAVGVDEDFTIAALHTMGERRSRKIEGIEDGKTAGGARSVVWRFCKTEDAVQFKAALHRDEEWEHCNVHYAADPCATATQVHFAK